ncbi:Ligand-binding protein, receptor family [Aphelenchoides besseyi]|nr:Ligand-binding protein, receptor family [Aphelenchoides besseyi]
MRLAILIVIFFAIQVFYGLPQMQREIKVGVLIPGNSSSLEELVGYERSIGALNVASYYIAQNGLIPSFNFTFDVQDDKCSESEATGRAVDMIEENQIELLVGPTCSDPANRVASVAKFFNVPLFTWGMTSSRLLANSTKFSTLVSTSGTTLSLAFAFLSIVEYFEWDRFAMIYSSDQQQRCGDLQSDLEVIVRLRIRNSDVRSCKPNELYCDFKINSKNLQCEIGVFLDFKLKLADLFLSVNSFLSFGRSFEMSSQKWNCRSIMLFLSRLLIFSMLWIIASTAFYLGVMAEKQGSSTVAPNACPRQCNVKCADWCIDRGSGGGICDVHSHCRCLCTYFSPSHRAYSGYVYTD